ETIRIESDAGIAERQTPEARIGDRHAARLLQLAEECAGRRMERADVTIVLVPYQQSAAKRAEGGGSEHDAPGTIQRAAIGIVSKSAHEIAVEIELID